MDAVKFLKEKKRMCDFFHNQALCSKCPIQKLECGIGELGDVEHMIAAVEAVEKWAAEHPTKTRQSVFLERYPDTTKDENGVIDIAPCAIEKSRFKKNSERICNTPKKLCGQCRHEYWNEEVE